MNTVNPIYLHAGAHRTGTSSFQMMLALNRDVIEAAGYDVTYPGRDGIPGGTLGLRLPSPRNVDQVRTRFTPSVRKEVAEKMNDGRAGLILSEENLPGRMIHFAAGQFYPVAEARFETLAGATEAPIHRVLFVVRDYADLFLSAHRKRAEDNLVEPFFEGRPRMTQMDRGWPELIESIQRILKPQEIVVMEYARRGRSVDLLRLLLPEVSGAPLIEPDRSINLSATDAALEALQAIYAKGEKLERAQWQAVIAAHREDSTPRGFSEFKPRQLSQLRLRYAADLDRLAAMPGIALLR